jgi:putative PIN family toxin of toxin-antitoxin system
VPAAERLRVVLDANVYVSAFHSLRGNHAKIWQAARRGTFDAVVSRSILAEVTRVLRRLNLAEQSVQRALREMAHVAEVVSPRPVAEAPLSDPDDLHILECAVEGRADLIVSNDHHLLNLDVWAGIPIIAAPDFRRMITRQARRTTK